MIKRSETLADADTVNRFCRLRISWMLVWTAVTLVVIGFWIRSYFDRTVFEVLVTPTHRYYVQSFSGCVALYWQERIFVGIELTYTRHNVLYGSEFTTNAGVRIFRLNGVAFAVSVSYWLLSLVAVFIAAMPWLRFRFSLRTLLIVTTLAALFTCIVSARP